MKVVLDKINYKGHFFNSVTIDIPQIKDYNEDRWMINYYICKELDRIIREA